MKMLYHIVSKRRDAVSTYSHKSSQYKKLYVLKKDIGFVKYHVDTKTINELVFKLKINQYFSALIEYSNENRVISCLTRTSIQITVTSEYPSVVKRRKILAQKKIFVRKFSVNSYFKYCLKLLF